MFSSRTRNAQFIQILIGLVLIVTLVLAFYYVKAALERQHITAGFDFLLRTTGWEIGFSLLPYKISDPYWYVILIGILNSLFIGLIGLGLATIVGVMIGAMRISLNPILRLIGTCYIEAIRNVPLILQAIFWYTFFTRLPPPKQAIDLSGMVILSARGIFLPRINASSLYEFAAVGIIIAAIIISLTLILLPRQTLRQRLILPKLSKWVLALGLLLALCTLIVGKKSGESLFDLPQLRGLNFSGGLRLSPEFAALLTAMSLYGGAFLGEIVRAGFLSVRQGTLEAAQALGLSKRHVFTHIHLPLAVRAVLPTMTNQYVWLIKATTLGIVVGFSDFFTIIATAINHSGQTLELIFILMVGFLLINNLLAALMNMINRKFALRGTQLRM